MTYWTYVLNVEIQAPHIPWKKQYFNMDVFPNILAYFSGKFPIMQ